MLRRTRGTMTAMLTRVLHSAAHNALDFRQRPSTRQRACRRAWRDDGRKEAAGDKFTAVGGREAPSAKTNDARSRPPSQIG